jgi:hypothetical protein
MKERRNKMDRRRNDLVRERSVFCNRRRFPDRRLNSILAEWIPLQLLESHPASEQVLQQTQRAIAKHLLR